MHARRVLSLRELHGFADHALLLMRVIVGAFLIWGVWDNIVDATRMHEFVAFLQKFGFAAPELMARVSVWAQFLLGIAFVLGGLTRWAGVLCAIHFVVAIVMVDRYAGIRGSFPSLCLVLIGLYLATYGAGRFSLDRKLGADAIDSAR